MPWLCLAPDKNWNCFINMGLISASCQSPVAQGCAVCGGNIQCVPQSSPADCATHTNKLLLKCQ